MIDKEKSLYDEMFDIDHDIFDNLDHLVYANWDSDTLKSNIQSLLKQKQAIESELYNLDKKE